MFVEDLESLPENLRDEFVESERDGKKGFQHKDTVALLNSMKNAKHERDELRGKFEEVSGKLSEFEKTQQEAIQAAKEKALEDARNSKDVDAIEQRYQQQMADLEKRVREEAKNEALTEYKSQSANEKAKAIADKIGLSIGVGSDEGEVIAELIRSRVKVDPNTGEEIYHDAKGSALSVDRQGFIDEIKKESRFKRLIKAEVATTGGGNVNGAGVGGAGNKTNQAAEQARKNNDGIGHLNAHFAEVFK